MPTDLAHRAARALRALRQLLGHRIAAAVAIGVLCLLALQALAIWTAVRATQGATAALRSAVQTTLPASKNAYELTVAVQTRILLMLRMLADADPFQREDDARDFEAQRAVVEGKLAALRALPLAPEAQAAIDRLLVDMRALSQVQRQVVAALRDGRDERAREILAREPIFEHQRRLQTALAAFAHTQERWLDETLARVEREQAASRNAAVLLGAALFALGAAIGVVVTRAAARAAATLENARRAAESEAVTDALTGVLNRRGLQRELARLCRADCTPQARHSLLVVDLDRFKAINDSAGHEAGDLMLRKVTEAMAACIRPADRIARVGGDEFVVVLRDLHGAAATAVAQRLVDAIGACELRLDGQSHRVGASIGVACFVPAAGERGCAAAHEAADAACYRAKQLGRGRVCVAP
jgi:diguanylate cyclase (GGDEF)-like protein